VNIGCVKLKEKLITQQPIPMIDIEKIIAEVSPMFAAITSKIKESGIDEMVAVAGTPTAIAALDFGKFIPEKVDGFKLTQTNILNRINEFSQKTPQQISDQYGLEMGRADIILAGCILLYISMQTLQLQDLTVSTRGVRYGLALEMAKNEM
jgi:exopolyphosphatase/guanosine-5'-triphosphate,3'-diphosphate pyrophosphatase